MKWCNVRSFDFLMIRTAGGFNRRGFASIAKTNVDYPPKFAAQAS